MRCLLIALLACSVIGCSKQPDKEPQAVAQPNITLDQALDAVARAAPHAKQICYVEYSNAYLLYYGPLLPDNVVDDENMHGWYYTSDVEFLQSSKTAWFVKKYTPFIEAQPSTDGLHCIDQKQQ